MDNYHFMMIMLGWLLAGASPGPATLAISSTAMEHGRKAGLTIASGILLGSSIWGFASALGMSAVMVANAWLFDVIRYLGAAYLLFLALKSLKSAINPVPVKSQPIPGKKSIPQRFADPPDQPESSVRLGFDLCAHTAV